MASVAFCGLLELGDAPSSGRLTPATPGSSPGGRLFSRKRAKGRYTCSTATTPATAFSAPASAPVTA